MNEKPEKGTRLRFHACQRDEADGVVVTSYQDDEGEWVVVRMDKDKTDYVKNPRTDDLDHVVLADLRLIKLGDGESVWSKLEGTGWNILDKYFVLEMRDGCGFAHSDRVHVEKAKELLDAAVKQIFKDHYDPGFAGSELTFHIVEREDPI